MKISEFQEATAIAHQRSVIELQLARVEKKGLANVTFGTGGSEEDPQTLDFLSTALAAFYKEKLLSFDRALIALGVEL